MRVSTHLHPHTPLGPAAEWSRKREELGFDTIWYGEAKHNPFLSCLLMAQNTERVEFGPNVSVAFARTPHVSANMAWDLQAFSGGRFILGLGTQVKGHNERRFSVPWGPPRPRLREYIECMRAIWDSWQNGTRPSFEGKSYRYTLTSPFFNPGPIEHPNVPIHISAINPYNCRLVGELCDGIKLHGFNTPKYYKEVIRPNIEKGAKKAGRDPKEIEICGLGFVITGPDQEAVEKAMAPVRQQIAFYGSTRTYKPVLDIEGWGDLNQELFSLSLEGKWQDMATRITDDMLEEFAIIGTYDEIVKKIKEKSAGIIDRLSFAIPVHTPDDDERLTSMIKELQAA